MPNTFVSLKEAQEYTILSRMGCYCAEKVSIITERVKPGLHPSHPYSLLLLMTKHHIKIGTRIRACTIAMLGTCSQTFTKCAYASSFAPSCESFAGYAQRTATSPNSKQHFNKFTLANLADEGKWGHYAFLSQATQQNIQRNMAQGTQHSCF